MESKQAPAEDEGASIDLFKLSSRWVSSDDSSAVAAMASEEEPSHLNTFNSSGMFHMVSTDKMSVQYVGSPQHGYDVGAVQANCPAPTRRIAYYFEMTVKNAGQKGQVAIGFTTKEFNLRRQPGWEANSCGYHGDDGYLYHGQGKGEPFGPTYTSDDTVGAGINYASQEFFFTKNGELVGTVCKDIKGDLYPTIAVHGPNEEVTVNFGKQPFRFDIVAFMLKEKRKQDELIDKLTLPSNVSHWVVRSYLLHYGYQDTVNSFDVENGIMSPYIPTVQENGFSEQGDAYALCNRKILRQLIRNGDIDAAFRNLREWYPQIVQIDTSVICFLLHSQKFIEYIREGQLMEAVDYARAELNKFFAIKPLDALLEDVVALLAYEDPSKSCVGYLLEHGQREFVADAVNAMVLTTNSDNRTPEDCSCSRLEKLLKQLTLCSLERRALNGNQGEAFDLQRVLNQGKFHC
ncbi:E3 ubiquitin-protein ligase RKP [Apostasia shenzhenica]|uniref:E3 ubiquitin-protein ligase RKP n=1 Tax=Apostasia shenzhenica TaxID=1088818 RepID=A0A2I0BBA7_9ASPA|nr:E3 ubiquitin-protein ligase RKP [Apostasia shenzhenica]